jgi:hypothetical protein
MSFCSRLPIRLVSVVVTSFSVLTLTTLFTGCYSPGIYQTPQTIKRGQGTVSAAYTRSQNLKDKYGWNAIDIFGRFGVADRLDMGLRAELYLHDSLDALPGKFTADIKGLLVDKRIDIALDGALSFDLIEFGFHPTLLVGNEFIYGAVFTGVVIPWPRKSPDNRFRDEPVTFGSKNARFMAGLLLGGSVGIGWFRVLPEAGAYVLANTADYVSLVPYVGLAFQFGPFGKASASKGD